MRNIEISKKITTAKKTSEADVKKALKTRLERLFEVDSFKDNKSSIVFRGTSGGKDSILRSANVELNIQVVKSTNDVRILASGEAKMSKSLIIFYALVFLTVFIVGLLSGQGTEGDVMMGSQALNTLVLLLFGVFMFYDIDKRVDELAEYIEAAFESLETEFGN